MVKTDTNPRKNRVRYNSRPIIVINKILHQVQPQKRHWPRLIDRYTMDLFSVAFCCNINEHNVTTYVIHFDFIQHLCAHIYIIEKLNT